MTYVPAFYDRDKDIVRRPWQVEAANRWLAVSKARERLWSEGKHWPLVQITVRDTGETVFRESVSN